MKKEISKMVVLCDDPQCQREIGTHITYECCICGLNKCWECTKNPSELYRAEICQKCNDNPKAERIREKFRKKHNLLRKREEEELRDD